MILRIQPYHCSGKTTYMDNCQNINCHIEEDSFDRNYLRLNLNLNLDMYFPCNLNSNLNLDLALVFRFGFKFEFEFEFGIQKGLDLNLKSISNLKGVHIRIFQ